VGAEAVEELQFSLGEGPSRDAFILSRPVLEPDLEKSIGRWPGYAPAALGAGIGSVFAFPLLVGAMRLGVLSLYDAVARTLSEGELADSLALNEFATRYVLDHPLGGEGGEGGDASVLDELEFRDEIYQAQGMVMVALNVSLAEALARMRAHAFVTEQNLTALAADIIYGRAWLLAATEDE